MRIVFCWMGASGYMAACWHELSKKVEALHVISVDEKAKHGNGAFRQSILSGISHEYMTPAHASDVLLLLKRVQAHSPCVVVLCGWAIKSFRYLVHLNELRHIKFVMAMDNPWLGTLRQRLSRFVLRSYLRRMSLVIVAGERCWQFATRLGLLESQIRRGVYGVDVAFLDRVYQDRNRICPSPSMWPKQFLFVGRLVAIKGIQTMIDGYTKYRDCVDSPWPLHVCGTGPYAERLRVVDGVHCHGFVQPNEMEGIWSDAGVFVLASTYDPWPLVVLEACAAGLPVLCSEACGSAVEVVRQQYNGLSVATADSDAFCDGLRWMHENHNRLSVMGSRGRTMAQGYSAEEWGDRWFNWLNEL